MEAKENLTNKQKDTLMARIREDAVRDIHQLKTAHSSALASLTAETERVRATGAQQLQLQQAETERVRTTGTLALDNAKRDYEHKRAALVTKAENALGAEKARALQDTDARIRELEKLIHKRELEVTEADAETRAATLKLKEQKGEMEKKLDTEVAQAISASEADFQLRRPVFSFGGQ